MKQKEKFVNEMIDIAVNGGAIAVDKKGFPFRCNSMGCVNCIAYGSKSCNEVIKDWAESEYVEPKVFTEEEKAFIRACDKIKYVVRNEFGCLYAFIEKPHKDFSLYPERSWIVSNNLDKFNPETGCFLPKITTLSFSAIKWEDAEPTSREEILR